MKAHDSAVRMRSGRPLRRPHAVRERHSKRPLKRRRSSSRRTGPRIARWSPNASSSPCGHRSSSMRTAFSSTSSATSPASVTSESAATRRDGPSSTGKTAIVTGGSHGLGLEIARAYVAAGARVLVCARDATALDRARTELESAAPDSGSVATATADVSEPEAVEGLVEYALERFSRIHVLVNNAGIYGPKGLTEDVDLGRVGAGRPGESLRLGPVQSRGAAALPGERVRQDHPALRRRRHLSAPAPERVRRLEGGCRPIRRDAGGGTARNGDRRQRHRTGRAEHPAPRRGRSRRVQNSSATRSTNALSSSGRAGARRSTSRLAWPSSSVPERATASPGS